MFDRLKLILTDEQLDKINNLKVLIVGVGGVGGYALESLVRTGVKNITIIDAFELAFELCEMILCSLFIIIYLIQYSDLRYPHFFKLEIIFIITINMFLHFFKCYTNAKKKGKENNEQNNYDNCDNCKYETIALIRAYLDYLIVCFSYCMLFNYDASNSFRQSFFHKS